jgi:Kef-type K+ transport system membrane component KefB
MKKWLFAIIAALLTTVICFTFIVLIFGETTNITLFIGAGISYYTGRYVYKYFNEKDKNAT